MITSRKELCEYIALETKNIENRILLYFHLIYMKSK